MSVASPLLTRFSCAFSSILCCEINIMYLRTKEKALGTNTAGQCLASELKSSNYGCSYRYAGGGVQDS